MHPPLSFAFTGSILNAKPSTGLVFSRSLAAGGHRRMHRRRRRKRLLEHRLLLQLLSLLLLIASSTLLQSSSGRRTDNDSHSVSVTHESKLEPALIYRVVHLVAGPCLSTSNYKLRHSINFLYLSATIIAMSTKCCPRPDVPPCTNVE